MEIRVKYGNEVRLLEARRGDNLLKVLLDGGMKIPHPCKGKGKCGKCRVQVAPLASGAQQDQTSEKGIMQQRQALTSKKASVVAGKQRLACLVRVEQPLDVVLPGGHDSRMTSGKSALRTEQCTLNMEQEGMAASAVSCKFPIEPPSRRICVHVGSLAHRGFGSRWDEVLRSFSGKDREVLVSQEEPYVARLDEIMSPGGGFLTLIRAGRRMIGLEPGDATKPRLGLAVLFQGRTLQMVLADITHGVLLRMAGCELACEGLRPAQAEKVFSAETQDDLRSAFDKLAEDLCKHAGYRRSDVTDLSIAGEVGRMHALSGLSMAPDDGGPIPVILSARVLPAERLGFSKGRCAGAWMAPAASARYGSEQVVEGIAPHLEPLLEDMEKNGLTEGPLSSPRMLAGILGCLLQKTVRRAARKKAEEISKKQG